MSSQVQDAWFMIEKTSNWSDWDYFTSKDSCLQDINKKGFVEWKLFTCESAVTKIHLQIKLHLVCEFNFIFCLLLTLSFPLLVTLLSQLFLVPTIFVFVYLKELRVEPARKFVLCFLISYWFYITFTPAFHWEIHQSSVSSYYIGITIILAGLYLSHIWLNIMCFDVWYSLR